MLWRVNANVDRRRFSDKIEFKSDCDNLKSCESPRHCVKVTPNAKIFLVFPFSVSHKVSLLNQLHNGTAMMNNQRTLEIIRDDLTSSSMVESEGTYWDSRHPHLFVVMGASVSLIDARSLDLFGLDRFSFRILG
jgi:hypothetical protein